ncbi:MAG: hypothetical protein PV362_01105 [Providencia heimbachae]|nr:hypothetical protein [Providencia heimbachae]
MNNAILELTKELKIKAQNNIGVSGIDVAPDTIIEMCEYIEKISDRTVECEEIIKEACADDANWHNLINNKEHERALMIALINHISDEYTKIKFELERINNLEPVVYASEKDISDLKIFTYLFAERQSSESVNIPLYRLD